MALSFYLEHKVWESQGESAKGLVLLTRLRRIWLLARTGLTLSLSWSFTKDVRTAACSVGIAQAAQPCVTLQDVVSG